MKSVNKCFNEVKKDCFKFISSQETKRDKFRNKDKTTNVLSFTNDDISLKQTNNIGDIAISVEYVLNESEDIGKNFDEHMIHMLAHGIYHILGHDHQVDSMAEVMESKEISTLKKLNINNPYH
mgnify:CR=1 FL=1